MKDWPSLVHQGGMQTGDVRVLILTLAAVGLGGCASQGPSTASGPSDAEHQRHSEREQKELERRLRQLEGQVLADLRKLRESRQASTGAAEPAGKDEPASPADSELLVFGGASHEVFLGCLCDQHHTDSVFNMLGEHGSHLSATSIRNKFGAYGSNYDDTSACSPEASRPPVVVAADGKSLGLLTSNPALKKRISAASVTDWLARMCGE